MEQTDFRFYLCVDRADHFFARPDRYCDSRPCFYSLKLPMDRFFVNVDRYGNTSAASIPLALHEAHQEGRIRPGDLVLLVAFGAGLTYGGALVRW